MQTTSSQIVARSQAFRDIMALARRVSNSPCSVLVSGESGTGKELIARTIHDACDIRTGKYIPLDVAAMPGELVESQLFGHVRGAFSGASENRSGAFRAANNGTLLLDEIGDLPIETQPKLLRALEQREVIPVGADEISMDHLDIEQDCTDCNDLRLDKAVDGFKRRHIVGVLERVKGSRNDAAMAPGLSPATLFRYIDRYNLKGYGCKADHSHRRKHEILSGSHH